ncbi:MAG: hypothetical protein KME16_04485 [Scytolyngbya sp. HA4215-MV1]|jgi:hypothetical protein|nr:hypothetical protein [Scytolyngbya sp. HA4215-MV1]
MLRRQFHRLVLFAKPGLNLSLATTLVVSSGLLVSLPGLMKGSPGLLPVLAETATAGTNPVKAPDITGTWQGELAPGRTVTWIFAPQGKLFFMTAPPPEGLPPKALELHYQVNASSKPMGLNIDLAENRTVLTIFELAANDQMRIQILGTAPGQPRPTTFDRPSLFRKVSPTTALPPNTEVVGGRSRTH